LSIDSIMRILMITELFPPLVDAESIVAGKFAKALVEEGIDLHVVAGDFSQSGRLIDDSHIWQSQMGSVIKLRTYFGKIHNPKDFLGKFMLRNEATNYWAYSALRKCRHLLKKYNYDLIISRTWTVNAMIVAYHLQEYKRMPWVIIMDDPYPESVVPTYKSNYSRIYNIRQKLRRNFIRNSLQSCLLAIFPSSRLQNHIERSLELNLAEKSLVLPHIGWYYRPGQTYIEDSYYLDIVHCGRFNPPRASNILLEAFRNIFEKHHELSKRTRIIHVGYPITPDVKENINRFNLKENITFEGPVGYEESLTRMSCAQALLLSEAILEEGIFLPSKFTDYIYSGKPLLMFSPENGAVADMVDSYNHPGFLGQSPQTVYERLERFMLAWEKKDDLSRYCFPDPEISSPEVIARKFMESIGDKLKDFS